MAIPRAKNIAAPQDKLVERAPAEASQGSGPSNEQTGNLTPDRELAKLHTGGRATYKPEQAAKGDGSQASAANVDSSSLAGSRGSSAAADIRGGETPVSAFDVAALETAPATALGGAAAADEAAGGAAPGAGVVGSLAALAGRLASFVAEFAGGGGAGGTAGSGQSGAEAARRPASSSTIQPSPDAIADVSAPTLAVTAVVGDENGTIPLDIDAALVDAGANQTLTVTIGGLPDGATLSAGVLNADGTYTLTGDELAGLTLTPATDSGEDFALTVTATATDNNTGVTADTATELPVTVVEPGESTSPDAIADVSAPTLAVTAVVGDENGTIPLDIDAALVDAGANQTLTVTIGGLPDGATLSAGVLNADGTYTLTGDELAGLTLTPATDSGEDFALTVTATATDNNTGVTADTATELPVTVVEPGESTSPDAIADVSAPTLAVTAVVGDENGTIPLDIDAALVDAGANQTLTVTIGGLPDGATLSAGVLNADGTYTLTGDELAGLTLTPATDSGEDFALTVTATATDNNTGVTADTATELPVTVVEPGESTSPDAIADVSAPTLAVTAVVGDENGTIPLDIDAALVDAGANQTLTVTIGGLPDGATLSAGVLNADGTYTLTGDELAGLTLTPATDSGEDFALTVTATATDNNTGVTADTATELPVTVVEPGESTSPDAIADVSAPTLAVTAVVGDENGTIPLDIDAALVDAGANQTLTVTIGGLPDGATLSAGVLNADGTYTLTGDELAGLTLTPATDSGEDFALTVTATATDNNTGVTADTATELPVTVVDFVEVPAPEPIAEPTAPGVTASNATGIEDQAIPLDIDLVFDGTETDGEYLVAIEGVPDGATLSAGTAAADGSWIVSADELDGLTLTPPQDSSEPLSLTVTPITVGPDDLAVAGTPMPLIVEVEAVADAPTLAAEPASGSEDTAIPLDIAAALTDVDGSETLSVSISGVPEGASLSNGIDNGDGTYTLAADELAELSLTPPQDFNGEISLTVTATTLEASNGSTATTTVVLPVTVEDVLDAPSLTVAPVVGLEDTPIALNIGAGLVDLSPTTTLDVTIDGLPAGSTLSAGVQNPDGSYTLSGGELAGLTLTPPQDYNGQTDLTVTAVATDTLTGTETTTTATLPLTVTDVLDAPSLTVAPVVGLEDTPIALNIGAGLVDLSPTTTLDVTIDGLPAGSTLSAGVQSPDGSYTLSGGELAGLTLTPPQDYNGQTDLTVTAVATDTLTGTETTTTATLPLTVTDVLDAPSLTVAPVVGLEDTPIALNIGAGLVDLSPTTTLDVTIDGLPAGSTLSAGVQNPDGSYTLSGGELAGLTLTPPQDYNGQTDLTVTAVATDTLTGTETTTTATLPLTVTDVLDAPSLTVAPVVGLEDTPIALNIGAGLVDLSPTTTLDVTIDGLPAGSTLSAGVQSPDGSYTLSGGELAGLTLTPPQDYNGQTDLTVTAVATDTLTGTETTTTATLPLTVTDVLDAPSLTVAPVVGLEDTPIALNIGAGLVDLSPTTTLDVTIDGLPAGSTLSAGVQNPDGSYTLSGGELAGLTLTPPQDYNGQTDLTVTAVATDTLTGTETTTTATLPLTVTDVLDAPSLTVAPVVGLEDTPIALNIGAGLVDLSPTTTLDVTIDGLPAGSTLSAGVQNPDGSYTLSGGELAGLTLTPPQDYNGQTDLTVTAVATDTLTGTETTTTATLPLTVTDVLDAPSLTVAPVVGLEDTPIALNIGAGLVDLSPTTTLDVTIDGLPAGSTLSAGVQSPDGSYTLSGGELAGLTLTPPQDYNGQTDLTVTAVATDTLTGTETTTTATLPLTVTDVLDAPVSADVAPAAAELTEAEFALALETFAASAETTALTEDALLDAPTTTEPDTTTTDAPVTDAPPTETIPEPPDTSPIVTIDNPLQSL